MSEQHLDVLAQPTRLAPQDFAMARAIKLGARAASELRQSSCVDGSELARAFFPRAALVGAAMCSAF